MRKDKITMTVCGYRLIQASVVELLIRSAWFEVTPLPDDEYNLSVKHENKYIFDKDFGILSHN